MLNIKVKYCCGAIINDSCYLFSSQYCEFHQQIKAETATLLFWLFLNKFCVNYQQSHLAYYIRLIKERGVVIELTTRTLFFTLSVCCISSRCLVLFAQEIGAKRSEIFLRPKRRTWLISMYILCKRGGTNHTQRSLGSFG